MLLILLSPVLLLMTSISTNNALHINIEFILPKNNSDPSLADLFKKVINVNVTAVAESVDKHIIRVDSVLALNRTIEFKNNKMVFENEADLIRKLIELAPLITTNASNSSSTSRTITTTRRTTRSPDQDFFDYDASHHHSTHSFEFTSSDYSTDFDELTTPLFEYESTPTDESHHQQHTDHGDHSSYAPNFEDYNYPNYPPQPTTTRSTRRSSSRPTTTTTTTRWTTSTRTTSTTTQRGQRTSSTQRTTTTSNYRTSLSRNTTTTTTTTTTQRWGQSKTSSRTSSTSTTTIYTRYPTKSSSTRTSPRTSSSWSTNRSTTTTTTRKTTTTTTTPFPKIKCPPSYRNFCLNAAECYYRSRADLDLGEEPLCECARPLSVLYGVMKKSNAGVRCELVAYSFTPLGYALAVVLSLLIVCLLFTLCSFICGCRRRSDGPTSGLEVAIKKNKKTTKQQNSSANDAAKPKCSNSDPINDSWRFVKSDPATKSRNEFYFKRFRGVGASAGRRTIQKYIEKQTRNILKSIEGLMASSSGGSGESGNHQAANFRPHIDLTDNFIFVNRCFREDGGGGGGNQLNDPSIAVVSSNGNDKLDAKCASNIGVYPKPMRSSNDDNNVFNARCGQNEQTVANGSLFY